LPLEVVKARDEGNWSVYFIDHALPKLALSNEANAADDLLFLVIQHLDVLLELVGGQVDLVVALAVVHVDIDLETLHHLVEFLAQRDEVDAVVEVAIRRYILLLDHLQSLVAAAQHLDALEARLEKVLVEGVDKGGHDEDGHVDLGLLAAHNLFRADLFADGVALVDRTVGFLFARKD